MWRNGWVSDGREGWFKYFTLVYEGGVMFEVQERGANFWRMEVTTPRTTSSGEAQRPVTLPLIHYYGFTVWAGVSNDNGMHKVANLYSKLGLQQNQNQKRTPH